jgi:type II secretory pathway pseudopilin PulG
MTLDNRNDRRRRHGFMLFEMLVALAFLAIASGVALNVHQARLDYDRRAMDRLRQQLAIENLAEQLASIPYSEIPDAASELGIQSGAQVDVDPFELESKRGLHVIVRIESESGPLNHHLWRLEP